MGGGFCIENAVRGVSVFKYDCMEGRVRVFEGKSVEWLEQ